MSRAHGEALRCAVLLLDRQGDWERHGPRLPLLLLLMDAYGRAFFNFASALHGSSLCRRWCLRKQSFVLQLVMVQQA
jgi:hypothetical protein